MTASNQKYLKAIYLLSEKQGSTRVADIAEVLSVSKASVCYALTRLSDKGFIAHELYGDVRLTVAGVKRAKAIIASYEKMKSAMGSETVIPSGFEYLMGVKRDRLADSPA